LSDRAQDFFPMSQQDTQRLQIALIQLGQDIPSDRIALKRLAIYTETKVIQPF
jgi:hypothetical protein